MRHIRFQVVGILILLVLFMNVASVSATPAYAAALLPIETESDTVNPPDYTITAPPGVCSQVQTGYGTFGPFNQLKIDVQNVSGNYAAWEYKPAVGSTTSGTTPYIGGSTSAGQSYAVAPYGSISISTTTSAGDVIAYTGSQSDDMFVNWISTFGVDIVMVKAGPGSDVYVYTPEAFADLMLESPNGSISHVTFCWDDSPQPSTLIVKKIVVNDNGGTKLASDFTFAVNGGSTTSFEADGQNDLNVDAGTYSVVEAAAAGYTTSYDNCSDVVIASGGTATCTITNNDQPGTLIVKKIVVNDNGGTKLAIDFSFSVNRGSAVTFEADGQNDLSVSAGTYSVAEIAVDGYTATYENCTDMVIANGGTATCTITNNDQPGTLIVKKIVVNDNGGAKLASDFSFAVNGGDAISFEADGQNDFSANAGTYNIVETAAAGYTTSYDNCSDMVIANGGTATCTVTNDDQPGTLIVKKIVINDNGGTKVASDFSFAVNGGDAISFEADGENSLNVNAGNYTILEPSVDGYTASYENCSNLDIPNGGSTTCTITNNDAPVEELPATLIVKKIVVNDNDGTKLASDFSFSVNGAAVVTFEADGQNDFSVSAGTYSIVETAADGYAVTYENCSNVVIASGGTATCTITNNDVPVEEVPATLIVKKIVVNDDGGTKIVSDFSFAVNDGGAVSFEADGQNDFSVDAGTYSVVEIAVEGYTATYDNCTDVVIASGGTATCTITNNDKASAPVAKLTLVKTALVEDYEAVGDLIPYSYLLTNEGDVVLNAPFTVADNKTSVTCPAIPVSIAPGESITCTATYVITEADVETEFVTNVATGSAKDPQGDDVVSNQDQETVTLGTGPTGLPTGEQPQAERFMFLPTIQTQE